MKHLMFKLDDMLSFYECQHTKKKPKAISELKNCLDFIKNNIIESCHILANKIIQKKKK